MGSISSFALYGFPESHAISFALIAYASAWLKVHRPAEFYVGLLNNQPMGFYSRATLVKDAKHHGLRVRPVDVAASGVPCAVEGDGVIRLGLNQVKSLGLATAVVIKSSDGLEGSDLRRAVGHFGAAAVDALIAPRDTVALAGGRTIHELVHHLPATRAKSLTVVQAMGTVDSSVNAFDAQEVGRVMAQRLGGSFLSLNTPAFIPEKRTREGVVTRGICPSSTGAKEWNPSAFSPRTGLLYIPAHNTCMDYEGLEANYIAGTPYLGANVKMYQGPGGYHGELVAWDPVRATKVWGIRDERLPLYSGVLATAGDLVFYGTMDGWFRAVDARSGVELWKFKTASGIVGNPVTYVGPDGKQYVAVYSGVGGWMGAVAFPSISLDDPYAALGVVGAMGHIKKVTAPGSVLYVFGLEESRP